MKPALLELPDDPRDITFGAVFTLPKLSELPKAFKVGRPTIKDQYVTWLCTAFGVSSASEYQEGVMLSPEYQAQKISLLSGQNIAGQGADLRMACKSAQKYGSLPIQHVPEDLRLTQTNESIVADPAKWPAQLDLLALPFKKDSYLAVSGPYDMFDNMRATMYAERAEKKAIVTGALWRGSWTGMPGGVINYVGENTGTPHCFIIFGWDGEYLLAHLSGGQGVGDGGVFMLHRNVVNSECTYGAFTFEDISPEQARHLIDIGAKAGDNWLKQIILSLQTALLDLLGYRVKQIQEQVDALPVTPTPMPPTNAEKLLDEAKKSVGKDISPRYDALGCAESINTLLVRITGKGVGKNIYSTSSTYEGMEVDQRFRSIDKPVAGCLAIWPTGTGNWSVKNGHIGIVGEDLETLYSNNSVTGLFDSHLTLTGCRKLYVDKGGMIEAFFILV